MPNYNPETGIAYGVMNANKVPELFDTIIQDGVNETLEAAEEDVRSRLMANLADLDADELFREAGVARDDEDDELEAKEEALLDWLKSCIEQCTELDGNEADDCAERCMDVIDTDSGTFKISELVDEVMSYLHENEYFNVCDECDYSYTDGEFSYLIGWLGGAPLLWVTNSPYATYCRACSPCVPGAADLDSCTTAEGANILGYCLDPADLDEDDRPYLVFRVDADGNVGETIYEKKENDQ